MAPTRKAKAPTSRVYHSSAPAPRQQRLRPSAQSLKLRSRSIAPTVRDKTRQSTLTQLDFVDLEDDSDGAERISNRSDKALQAVGDEDEQVLSDEEWELPAAKRRKTRQTLTESERKRQQTLTQMDCFLFGSDNDGQFEVMEDDEISRIQETRTTGHHSPESPRCHDHVPVSRRRKHVDGPAPVTQHLRSHAAKDFDHSDLNLSYLQTPSRRMKAEIPSSLSPAGTPLHTEDSPHKQQSQHRTPLSEIHPNVLATRDFAIDSAKGSQGKKRPVDIGLKAEEDELFSDNENYLPDSESSSEDEVAANSPTKARKHINFTQPLSSNSLALTSKKLPHQKSRTCRTIGPSSPVKHTIPTSQASTVEYASPQSKCQNSPFNSLWTQSPPGTFVRSRSSSPVADSAIMRGQDSLLSSKTYSQLPESVLGNITQIQSINDSADIITASQMMRSSPS